MPPDDLSQLLGHGEDHVNGGDRQAFLPALCQPDCAVEAMTLRATAVAADVVDIVFLATATARSQLPPQRFSPAGKAIVDGPVMARPQVLPEAVHVLVPIAPEDVPHLSHAEAPARSEISHEGGDGRVHHVQGRWRQVRVARGGPRAPVAQPCLNTSQRHPPCPQMGRIGVP
jgi:hypothetical protein